MASTISAQTSGGGGIVTFGDASGVLQLQTNGTPTVTVDTSGNVTLAGSLIPTQTNGIVGTTTNNNANAGSVGEYVSAQLTAPTSGLTSGTAANVISISLTAGDWDVSGAVFVNLGAGTAASLVQASINTVSATNQGPTTGYCTYLQVTFTTSGGVGTPVPTLRLSLSTTTTVYLVVSAQFTVSTAGAGGFLRARRMR